MILLGASCAVVPRAALVSPASAPISELTVEPAVEPVESSDEADVEVALGEPEISVEKIEKRDPLIEIEDFDMTIKGAIKKLTELDDEGHKQIYVKIDSYGGSIHWGMELVQHLEGLKTPITCVVDWKAYSMGAFLLESDGCDKRLMTKRSTILFHEPLVPQTGGNEHELRNTADHLRALGKALVASTAERLKMSEKKFESKIRNKSWVMSYREALRVKAVDGIVKVGDLPKATPFEKPSLLQMLLGGD